MYQQLLDKRIERTQAIAKSGGLRSAIESGLLPKRFDLTLSEAVILGLLRQNVKNFIGIFGHGSTDMAEVLRSYENAGLVKMFQVRHETEAVHAATALRWVTGEKSAVITSIGPGALHALAGALAPLSDGIGVWFLIGDETTENEGPNMQQIPGHEQDRFLRLFSAMGKTYMLHTKEAVSTALRRGLSATEHPFRSGPFFLLMPMNMQPAIIPDFNPEELPQGTLKTLGAATDDRAYNQVTEDIFNARKVVVKIGGGGRKAGPELLEFLNLSDGVAVTSPIVPGIIPFSHPRNMTVGGSKGSISGNYAMEEADLLVAVGTRFVCQSDSSRTGYPNVKKVININCDPDTALHYGNSTPMIGDASETLKKINAILRIRKKADIPSPWLKACMAKRKEWDKFRQARYDTPSLFDDMWGKNVLTQPAAIKTATDWARKNNVISFFDAGDVQANGFQIVEDDQPGLTFTETGASYMGFAVSALLSTAMAKKPFYAMALSGDGSFMMNPQILIDGVEHGATGCILLFDNRRMAAISGLQNAQYDVDYATNDSVEIDYFSLATSVKGISAFDAGYSPTSLLTALENAKAHNGLSLVYVRVYSGDHPLGNMGVFGRWNVGNWCRDTQALRHEIGL